MKLPTPSRSRLVRWTIGAALLLAALPVLAQVSPEAERRLRNQIRTGRVSPQSPTGAHLPPAPVPPPPHLRPRVAYKVELDKESEEIASKLVGEKLQAVGEKAPAVTVPGVERQLILNSETEVQLQAIVLAGNPLTFKAEENAYVGTIRVGVAALDAATVNLSVPVRFDVVESGMADPSSIEVTTSSPPFATINIKTPSVKNGVKCRVSSRFDREGTEVSLPIAPQLVVGLDRSAIQGYGLETTRLHVETIGVEKPGGTLVSLHADPSAHFGTSPLKLADDGTADTLMRSDGTGNVVVTAKAAGLPDGTAPVTFDPPWRTIVSALIGGLLGSLVRIVPGIKRGANPGRTAALLVVGILVGLLVFGLLAVGVNTLLIDYEVRVGDVFVLIASAMGAWAGTLALPRPPDAREAEETA
jgi:hypothetical protein